MDGLKNCIKPANEPNVINNKSGNVLENLVLSKYLTNKNIQIQVVIPVTKYI